MDQLLALIVRTCSVSHLISMPRPSIAIALIVDIQINYSIQVTLTRLKLLSTCLTSTATRSEDTLRESFTEPIGSVYQPLRQVWSLLPLKYLVLDDVDKSTMS